MSPTDQTRLRFNQLCHQQTRQSSKSISHVTNRPDKAQIQPAMPPTDQTRLRVNQPCHQQTRQGSDSISHVTNRQDKAQAQAQSAMSPTDQTRLRLNQPCHQQTRQGSDSISDVTNRPDKAQTQKPKLGQDPLLSMVKHLYQDVAHCQQVSCSMLCHWLLHKPTERQLWVTAATE